MKLRNGRSAMWLVVLVSFMSVACTAAGDGPGRAVTSSAVTTSTTEHATAVRTASSKASSSPDASTGVLSKSRPSEPTAKVTPSPATTPPPPPAQPVLIIRWQSTGGSCADEQTLVPKLVVYADGRAIRTDPNSLGQYCEPLPSFRAGNVDLGTLRARVEAYLNTQLSKIDMSHSQVFDAGLTVLEYTAGDGSRRSIAADAIDFGLDAMTVDQRRGRAALAATIADVDKLTPTTTRWTPRMVSVIKPAKWVPRYSSTEAPAWPIPVTPAIRQLPAGADGLCTAVAGPAAARLLTAAQTRTSAAAAWTINGRPTFLVIGVVIDGFLPCS